MSEEEKMITLLTYGKSKAPDPDKIRAQVLAILKRKVNGDLQFVRVTELRRRICNKVKAPSFFALLKQMEAEELLMISGSDMSWSECAVWDHPRLIEWRIEYARFCRELEESEQRELEERRQWEIENAPRLARKRFQKEAAEFFVDNSDLFFDVLKNAFQHYTPRRKIWLHSRSLV